MGMYIYVYMQRMAHMHFFSACSYHRTVLEQLLSLPKYAHIYSAWLITKQHNIQQFFLFNCFFGSLLHTRYILGCRFAILWSQASRLCQCLIAFCHKIDYTLFLSVSFNYTQICKYLINISI